MKKALSILLALVLCLSLWACGEGESKTTEPNSITSDTTTPETTVPPTTEAPQETELLLNEASTLGDFEFKITYVRFLDYYTTSGMSYSTGDGYYYIQVDYLVKNISKTSKWTPLNCLTADYNNGYVFEIFNSYRDVAVYDGGVQNAGEMAPLSGYVDCRAYITVPEEVYTSENPLSIKVKLSDGEGTAEAVFNMRPMSEAQQEAYYNTAVELMNTATNHSNYYYATSLFEALGEYRDTAVLNEKAYLNWYALTFSAGSKDKVNFFAERIENFPVLTGEEITSVFIGDWDFTKIADYPITIHKDGSIANYWSNDNTWRIEGNNWIMNNGKVDFIYEVRYVMDGVYLLVENGLPSQMMIKVK